MSRPVPLPPVHATGATQAGLPVVHVEGEGLFTAHVPVTSKSGWCLDARHGERCYWKPCACDCHKVAS